MSETSLENLIGEVHQQFEEATLSYGHGTDNPWDEAVSLVLSLTGYPDDTAVLARMVSAAVVQRVRDVATQRIQTRQPLAYLLGVCHYMGLEFDIEPGVIVPRSPIGYLLQDGLAPWLPGRIERIADLCCGSGCLGIVAAHCFQQAQVTMVELDEQACELAHHNIARHGLGDRVDVVTGDVTAPLNLGKPFDLIVSNPPYVDAADMAGLLPEFQAEPMSALAAGDDGLAVMRGILQHLPDWLAHDGIFVGEVGGSAAALIRAFPEIPFVWLDLPLGGEGVFLLEAGGLTSHTARGL